MKHKTYKREIKKNFDMMLDIVSKKSRDYSGEEDAFKNFKMCETLGVCSVEAGILTRMTDKLSRVANLLTAEKATPEVDESISDTLMDLANYAIILKVYNDDLIQKSL